MVVVDGGTVVVVVLVVVVGAGGRVVVVVVCAGGRVVVVDGPVVDVVVPVVLVLVVDDVVAVTRGVVPVAAGALAGDVTGLGTRPVGELMGVTSLGCAVSVVVVLRVKSILVVVLVGSALVLGELALGSVKTRVKMAQPPMTAALRVNSARRRSVCQGARRCFICVATLSGCGVD